jgi:hypothetical protein
MIGEKISPILVEVENALWEFEIHNGCKTGYTKEGFRAAVKIFMSVIMDKMWELQEAESIDMKDREGMAAKAGQDFRALIKTYTDIDCYDLYKK